MKKVVINGKFLSQNVTGIQRYAREILLELDKIADGSFEIILAVDKKALNIPKYRNIKVRQVGILSGNLWEQFCFPIYSIKEHALCVNLCNMTPLLAPHIVVIHDISFRVNRQFFSKKFAAWYNFVFDAIIHKVKKIITVSDFSRCEIAREYKIDPSKISVTYNSWQHFDRVDYDENALEKYGLKSHNYCFAMSSLAPNKNFRWIAENAMFNPDMTYVIGGSINRKVFGKDLEYEIPDNLRFLGYISDSEAKTIMRECSLFLFPTFYEGFGIPPLEAISVGARVAVSDASCMREIFSDNVAYLDPYNPCLNIYELMAASPKPDKSLLGKYSWRKSAAILFEAIKELLDLEV